MTSRFVRILSMSALTLLAAAASAVAQNNTFPASGNVGVKTPAPREALQIGDRWVFHDGGEKYIGFNVRYNTATAQNLRMQGGNGSSLVRFDWQGGIVFETGAPGNAGTVDPTTLRMRIQQDGKVTIGDAALTTPGTFRLYVQDGILTERVKVSLKSTADWADYVFAPGYRLRPLPEVADSIATHQHLPGVPSATEMAANGLDVVQTDRLQQEKIEELFLYVIELQRQLEALKQQLATTTSPETR